LDAVEDFGGQLVSGAYQFALAYVDRDGTRTNFFHLTNPVPITEDPRRTTTVFQDRADGSPEGTVTSKSIRFTVSELDDAYAGLRVAVIHWKNGSDFDVSLLPDVPIQDASLTYTYTGVEGDLPSSLDEVVANRAYYEKAAAIRELDGILYLGNLTRREDLGYQRYANAIETELVTENVNFINQYGHREATVLFDRKSFRRDETYAFYIS